MRKLVDWLWNRKKQAAAPRPRLLNEQQQALQVAANGLSTLLEEVVEQYNNTGCVCQYPRFHQYAGIDWPSLGYSACMSETEGLIHYARRHFGIEEMPQAGEVSGQHWTCKKCGSRYAFGWSDFSIHVNRSYLKLLDKKVVDVGAPPRDPMPFVVGVFGHNLPPAEKFQKMEPDAFRCYLLEKK